MKKIITGALLGASSLLAVAQPASAAVTFYTNRADFEAALGAVQIEDFADTLLIPNLAFASTAGAVTGGTFSDLAFPGTTSTTFTYASSIYAFGGEFNTPLSLSGVGLKFTIVPPGTALAQELSNTANGGFFGFISNTAFSSVLIEGGTQSGFLPFETYTLDNLTISTSPAIPEPETWMLLIAGFGLLGSGMRRSQPTLRVRFN